MKKNNNFQLIHPIVGNKIYQTSFNKASKKCYDELNSLDFHNHSYFTIINLDTKEVYTFKINKKNKFTSNDFSIIKKNIQNIETRLDILENKINNKDEYINLQNISNKISNKISNIEEIPNINKKNDDNLADALSNSIIKDYNIKQNMERNDDNELSIIDSINEKYNEKYKKTESEYYNYSESECTIL
jgi:hypothetical protein